MAQIMRKEVLLRGLLSFSRGELKRCGPFTRCFGSIACSIKACASDRAQVEQYKNLCMSLGCGCTSLCLPWPRLICCYLSPLSFAGGMVYVLVMCW